ncbi:YggT family protein [Granulicoccus sp. GXG6511]|uniref:YggT family protein n=1 Tax=Granulicoccus sp. GXG6511 TaxID=3381351 RepID=UPI003D7D1933
MHLIGSIIDVALWLYLAILFARMILSWVPMFSPNWQPRGAMLVVAEGIYTLTDPPLRFLRKFIPAVRVGNVMLDLGFMVLWLLVLVLRQVNISLLLT